MQRRPNTDAILRLLRILAMLPRAPRKVGARSIYLRLRDEGHPVTLRTVERDLHRLRSALPIVLDDQHRPYGWSWDRDASCDLSV